MGQDVGFDHGLNEVNREEVRRSDGGGRTQQGGGYSSRGGR